ncbi:uncharacterized protein LOC117649746 isoform X1 [Thrips palmi]|uniref:Uncharacterized protein LOC117649746 isoform X1 n=1 Tax=Thrips palmi TaxID=161013 RepID=A0A6P8ZTQ8_THRPL|nr:uncharacterized protein LOC117649746 isoform X1 [Thrips palmi]
MKRTLLLLLLLMALQSLIVTTADTATTNHQPPGETLPSMCGQRRSNAPTGAEGQRSRRVRCAPREELPPELKHQYTSDQVVGIVQDIKHRLGHLQVPSLEKQRKSKGRRRPPKQPKGRK